MIQVKLEGEPLNFDAFSKALSDDMPKTFDESLKAIINDIIQSIQSGVGYNKQRFPPLAASTIKRKKSDQPLIDKGILIDASTYEEIVRLGEAQLVIRPIRADVAEYLQSGVGKGRIKKYFEFFGISKESEDKFLDIISGLIDKAIKEI